MAKKKRRRKAGKRKSKQSTPGWVWMLCGLGIGLTVAVYVMVNDVKLDPGSVPSLEILPAKNQTKKAEPEPEVEPAEEFGFDFYELLPEIGVEIYEDPAAPARQPATVSEPGLYILQAGSFTRNEDANSRKAEIALLGYRSEIRKGEANGRRVFRVYTDAIKDPREVNRISKQLNKNGIEVLVKRVK